MSILIDTSILVALAVPTDFHHRQAREAIRSIRTTRVIAIPVLPEVFYLLSERVDYAHAVQMFEYIQQAGFQIEPLTPPDMKRMTEIMNAYRDNRFDFADVAIMALAERFNITDILTFDRRDFSVFRPKHCDYLTLLP
jgi:predicted nucleic acid-binding protein